MNFKVFGLLFLINVPAFACDDWFKKLKITDSKDCESKCVIAGTDMSSYMCPERCESLCKKKVPGNVSIYGLTEDEIKFCTENKIDCLKAYKESWNAEKICLSIYPVGDTNDESDACRHYVWSILLSRTIGEKKAEDVLNAHENNPREPKNQQAMDLANNRLGLLNYQRSKGKFSSDEEIKKSFIEQIKNNRLVILEPNYKTSGGLP